jgi:outer membrane lipoprotein-sorting protein
VTPGWNGTSIVFGLLASALGVVGCASAPAARPAAAPRRPPRATTFEEAVAAYDRYAGQTESLSASGDLDVRDLRAGRARKLGFRMVAARGGKLYLKGSIAIVTALEVVSDGERFWFQVPSKKTVWTGPAQGAAETSDTEAPYYALRPRDVTAALLPEPLTAAPDEALLFETTRETVTVSVARPAGHTVRRRVSLDREQLRPIRLVDFDARGEVSSDTRLAWQGDSLQRVEIDRPVEGYQALLSFDKLERNATVPARAFVPRTPQDYAVVEVR